MHNDHRYNNYQDKKNFPREKINVQEGQRVRVDGKQKETEAGYTRKKDIACQHMHG